MLLAGWLLNEQLACPTRQAKHVDCLIDRRQCGLLEALDFA
jgi:hypothetical protein